ncbi:tetraspanin-9-like [Mercenaria mercenaria]|uniref:tetraspanin-9-like n=1 Tax=Mercenaria mercenaria TaxID=6596 RepID=UPI001E1DFDD5|nr:tetraspanin-9-like [Mercenaria mercenaria]
MASTQYRVTQILFILCNILFLIMGVAMVVVGAYLQISRSNYVDLMPSDEFFTATALMISSGTIVVVVCLFGFIGVWMQSQCVMLIYLLCVLVILTLSVAAGIIAFVFHREIDVELKGKLLEGLKDKNKRDEWDDIQSSERCCGVSNYTDWYGVYDPDYPESLPDSCCDGPNCGSQGRVVAYDVGCYKKGKDWIKDNFYTLGAAGIVLGILQIISIAAALALLIMMRREKVV